MKLSSIPTAHVFHPFPPARNPPPPHSIRVPSPSDRFVGDLLFGGTTPNDAASSAPKLNKTIAGVGGSAAAAAAGRDDGAGRGAGGSVGAGRTTKTAKPPTHALLPPPPPLSQLANAGAASVSSSTLHDEVVPGKSGSGTGRKRTADDDGRVGGEEGGGDVGEVNGSYQNGGSWRHDGNDGEWKSSLSGGRLGDAPKQAYVLHRLAGPLYGGSRTGGADINVAVPGTQK